MTYYLYIPCDCCILPTHVKMQSQSCKLMISYLSYNVKIVEKSSNFSMLYQENCMRSQTYILYLYYFSLIHARNIYFRSVRPFLSVHLPLKEIVLKNIFSDIEYSSAQKKY